MVGRVVFEYIQVRGRGCAAGFIKPSLKPLAYVMPALLFFD
jgi:hypothetical protein